MDSFEMYGTETKVMQVYLPGDLQSMSGTSRTGSTSVVCNIADGFSFLPSYIDWSNVTEAYTGIAFYNSLANTSWTDLIEFFAEDGSHHGKVQANTIDGSLRIVDTTGATIDTTGTGLYSSGSWNYIEVYLKVGDAAAGQMIVRFNSVEIFNDTTGDYKRSTYTDITKITYSGMVTLTYFDDLYLDDSQFNGPMRIHTFFPDSDETHSDFVRSSGSNDFEMVDEAGEPDDLTTYIEGSSQGDKSTFGFTLAGVVDDIVGVQLNHRMGKAAGGLLAKVKGLARVGGSDYDGSKEFTMTEGFLYHPGTMWEVNPDTSNPWNKGTVEAAEFGLHITTLSTTTTTTT